MSQVVHETIPDDPLSIRGASRSIMAFLEFIQGSGFHFITHALIALTWYTFLVSGSTTTSPVCITTKLLDDPLPAFWQLLSLDDVYRQVTLTLLLLVFGATIEGRLGSAYFLSVVLGNAIVLTIAMHNLFPGVCVPNHESLGPFLVSLCPLIHGNNPKISTEAYGHSVRTTFAVEPRWFAWLLVGFFVLFENSREVLLLYGMGITVGSLPWLTTIATYLWNQRGKPQVLVKVFRAVQLFVALTVFPFTLKSFDDFPFTGPTIMFDRDLIVTDWVSLVCIHLLTMSPLFLLLDQKQRVMPFVIALSIVAWIYCAQSPYFVYPGPGLLALALVVYSAVWFS